MIKESTNKKLEKKIAALTKQIKENEFSEKITQTLFAISNAVNTTISLNDFYQTIYNKLNKLLKISNFYIATYDLEKNIIEFPFVIDEFDRSPYKSRRLTKHSSSLTGEVILKGEPLFLTQDMLLKREKKNAIVGPVPKIWIGVPLRQKQKIIGVMATQNYNDPEYFNQKDLDILASISNQIAITIEHKRTLEKLNLLRNYLYNIINSMPSVLVGVDRDGIVTQWNLQAERKTGIKDKNACGKKLSNVFPQIASEMEKITQSIQSQKSNEQQKRCSYTGNGTIYEDMTIYPLITNGVEGAVIRIDDVTNKVRMQEIIIQTEKMLSVGGLAAGMAHEINNPLAGMMQSASVMKNRLTDMNIPANHKAADKAGISLSGIKSFMEQRDILRMIETIEQSGQRVVDIVTNMLSFARKSDVSVSSHVPSELLDKSLAIAMTDYDLKKQYDFKSIKIIKEYEDDLPMLPCDSSQIQQVLLNILRNGAQAMMESQNKDIEKKPVFILRVIQETKTNMLRIEIQDNGPGMKEDIRKRIFEPFFTTKPPDSGTGLGLSVSYFIITENHHGSIEVISQPGKGANFIIRLPFEARTL